MGLREFFGIKPKVNMSALPSNVSKLTGNQEQGPNCWNATMLYFHTDEIIRFVAPDEMDEWLIKHTNEDYFKRCTPGSILVLYADPERAMCDSGLFHTAVWVQPSLLWHKRGCGGPWEFITEKELRKVYPETTRYEYRLFKGKL